MIRLTFTYPRRPSRQIEVEGACLRHDTIVDRLGKLVATYGEGFWRIKGDPQTYTDVHFREVPAVEAPPALPQKQRYEVRLARRTTEHVTVVVDEEDVTCEAECVDYIENRLADEDWEPIAEGGDPVFGQWEIDGLDALPDATDDLLHGD